jgi:integrase/recombinase XerD
MDLETKGFDNGIEWYLDALKFERGASEHTLAAYGRDLQFAAAYFGKRGRMGWNELGAEDLSVFVTAAKNGVAISTARRRVSALRSLLKFLKKNGQGPKVDLPSAGGMRLPKRVPKALTMDVLERLLNSPDLSEATGIRDRTLMELVYGTGLRASEVVGLRVEEIELDQAAFRVTGKRGKTRWVPIPMHTTPWLERYLTEARPKLVKTGVAEVFVGARGRKLSRQSAYAILDFHRRNVGIATEVSPHTLRHTYAVHLIQGGADLRVVQELLGHASISTTQVYTQLDMEHVQRVYESAHPRK